MMCAGDKLTSECKTGQVGSKYGLDGFYLAFSIAQSRLWLVALAQLWLWMKGHIRSQIIAHLIRIRAATKLSNHLPHPHSLCSVHF